MPSYLGFLNYDVLHLLLPFLVLTPSNAQLPRLVVFHRLGRLEAHESWEGLDSIIGAIVGYIHTDSHIGGSCVAPFMGGSWVVSFPDLEAHLSMLFYSLLAL